MEKKTNKATIKKLVLGILIFILIICSILLYSRYISTSGLIIKEYKITNEKITDNFHGLKIVHISDIHYGTTIQKKELTNVINQVNNLHPDIVVLTGDLLDENVDLPDNYETELIEILSKIDTSIGKYAISGNHDYNFENFNIILEQSGFINLDNNYDKIYKNKNNYILISGMSTNLCDNKNLEEKLENTTNFLNSIEEEEKNNIYKILLIHEPDVIDNIKSINFDLVLAGHSHNGQIRLPFIGAIKKVELAKKYYNEHYTINNTELYISGGLGTSIIKFRFFNKPSINFYRITNK